MKFTFNHPNGRFLGLGYGERPADARDMAATMRQQIEAPRGSGFEIVSHEIVDGDMTCTVIPIKVGP